MSGINIFIKSKKDKNYFTPRDIEKLEIGDAEIDPSEVESLYLSANAGKQGFQRLLPFSFHKDIITMTIELIVYDLNQFTEWSDKLIKDMRLKPKMFHITNTKTAINADKDYATLLIELKANSNVLNIVELENMLDREKIYDEEVE